MDKRRKAGRHLLRSMFAPACEAQSSQRQQKEPSRNLEESQRKQVHPAGWSLGDFIILHANEVSGISRLRQYGLDGNDDQDGETSRAFDAS